jgi:hypothetical protein
MLARERLKAWRGSRTLREAGEILRCHLTAIRMLEKGMRKPGRELSLRIAHVAKIPVKAWEESSK